MQEKDIFFSLGVEVHIKKLRSAHEHGHKRQEVLTGRNSPHQSPRHFGALWLEIVVRIQVRLHEKQHQEQGDAEQTQDDVAYPGFRDLVEGVVNLQEEAVGNVLKSKKILEIDTGEQELRLQTQRRTAQRSKSERQLVNKRISLFSS